MTDAMKSYGVVNQNVLTDKNDLHLEELSILGYSVVRDVIPQNDLVEIRRRLDAVYKQQEAEVNGLVELATINEQNVARCLLAYDDYFAKLAAHPRIIEFVRKVLGNYFVLHLQNGIINIPNEEHHQSSWHRDLPYQEFTSSKPLAVNALFCIDDFSEASGGTQLLPVSHRIEKIPSQQYADRHGISVTASAGSVILMDSMIFHRAGYNKADFIRRAINHVYTVGIINQQINLPAALNGKFKDDKILSMLLGYLSESAISVKDFRVRRAEKFKKNT